MKYLKKFESWSDLSNKNKLKLGIGMAASIASIAVMMINHNDTEVVDSNGNTREGIVGEEFTGYVESVNPSGSGSYSHVVLDCEDGTKVYFTSPFSESRSKVGNKITIKITGDTWYYRDDAKIK